MVFIIFLPFSCFVLCWMAKAMKGLIAKLDTQFPEQTIIYVMGIVYPQY
jgi:hypothetical protein